MSRQTMAAAALVLALPALGGCQSTFGSSLRSHGAAGPRQPLAPAEYAATQLEEGRKALDSGQYGSAIAAFRNAQSSQDHAAAAHNGLAIAYSQIGRPDLAERYFKLAMSEAPGERRYQTNLDAFYKNWPEIAVRTVRPAATVPAAPVLADAIVESPKEAVAEAGGIEPDAATRQRIMAVLNSHVAPAVRRVRVEPQSTDPQSAALSMLRRAIASLAPRRYAAAPSSAGPVVSAPNSRATIRIEMPQTRTVRVSASEVRITAPPSQAIGPVRGTAPRTARAGTPAPSGQGEPSYPARVVLGGGK